LQAALQHIRQVAGSRGSTPDLAAESARIQQQLEAALQQQGAQAASRPSAP
jgi:hypothetical protein